MASTIFALEREIERPLIQLSAQFLEAPRSGSAVDVLVSLAKRGRSISQASALLACENRDAVRVLATLGARSKSDDQQWEGSLPIPAPGDCSRLPFIREDSNDLHTHLDIRQVQRPDQTTTGALLFWVKSPTKPDWIVAAPFLALISDYLPEAINGSIGKPAGAVSLDNQVRILSRDLSEWSLCKVQLSGVASGISHGRIHIFNEEGRMLAIGEQSAVVVIF